MLLKNEKIGLTKKDGFSWFFGFGFLEFIVAFFDANNPIS
jgi:hypothetical protein